MGRGMRWTTAGAGARRRDVLLAPCRGTAPAPTPEVLDPELEVARRLLGTRAAGLDGLPRRRRLPRAREGDAARSSGSRTATVRGTVLDLAVNSASERGLLSIALHPKFKRNGWVYLFWSQSKTGADTTALDGVRPMGNRVDRFEWDARPARVRPQHHQVPRLPGRREPAAARQPRRRRASASAPTASCTSSSATPAAAATRRTSSTARSGPASPTTSSAARRSTTCTSPA